METLDSAASATRAPSTRDTHSAIWTGSKMVVWGGTDGSKLNMGGVYDVALDSWTATTATGVPAARSNFTAVWADTQMIVWGGADGAAARLDSGGSYK